MVKLWFLYPGKPPHYPRDPSPQLICFSLVLVSFPGNLLQKDLCPHCCFQYPWPHSRPLSTHASPETPGHSEARLGQFLVWSLLLSPRSWCAQGFVFFFLVPSESLFPQSCGSSVVKFHWPPKSNSLGVLSSFAKFPCWEICCGS